MKKSIIIPNVKIGVEPTLDNVAKHIVSTYEIIGRVETTIAKCSKDVLRYSIEIGEMLCRVKEALPHGKFTPWFNENLKKKISVHTGRRYMKLWEHKDEVKDCDTLRQAYIKCGVIAVKENVDTWSEDPTENKSLKDEFDEFFKGDDTKPAANKSKGGGGSFLNGLGGSNDDPEAEPAKGDKPTKNPSKKHKEEPTEEEKNKSEEALHEQAIDLAKNTDGRILTGALMHRLLHIKEHEINAALKSVKLIVDWYNKHAKQK